MPGFNFLATVPEQDQIIAQEIKPVLQERKRQGRFARAGTPRKQHPFAVVR